MSRFLLIISLVYYTLSAPSQAASERLDPHRVSEYSKIYPYIIECIVVGYEEQWSSNGERISKSKAEAAILAVTNINYFVNDYEAQLKNFAQTELGKIFNGLDSTLYIATLKPVKSLYGNHPPPSLLRAIWTEGWNSSCPHVTISLDKKKRVYLYLKTPPHDIVENPKLGEAK